MSSADERYNAYGIEALKDKNIDADYPAGYGAPIRVVAGNITSGKNQSYDEGHGIRIFKALKADIVMIQEFNMTNKPFSTMVAVTFGPEFHYSVGKASIPNGVVSRFPIVEQGAWKSNVSANRDWDWAVVDIPGPKDILVVSVHLNTKDHNQEMQSLKAHIQAKVSEGDYCVLLGGDFNTKGRSNTEDVFSFILEAKSPYLVDQNGKDGTNASRKSPYDWILCNHAWAKFEVLVVIGKRSYPHGHVFDSR